MVSPRVSEVSVSKSENPTVLLSSVENPLLNATNLIALRLNAANAVDVTHPRQSCYPILLTLTNWRC